MEAALHGQSFKEDFIKRTERIRKEMDKGRGVRFKSVEEMDEYLGKYARG